MVDPRGRLYDRVVLFTKKYWPGIADGSVTLTFRRWRRRQAVPGNRYRTPAGIIEVDAVDVVLPGDITDIDAERSGHEDAGAVLVELAGPPDVPIYRVEFRFVGGLDPRDELAANPALAPSDLTDIDRRLDRMDSRAEAGPWTRSVLEQIAANPSVRAPDLASVQGRETQAFKRDVRKLKNLGLTVSLETGYRLSARGEAYLAARADGSGSPKRR